MLSAATLTTLPTSAVGFTFHEVPEPSKYVILSPHWSLYLKLANPWTLLSPPRAAATVSESR